MADRAVHVCFCLYIAFALGKWALGLRGHPLSHVLSEIRSALLGLGGAVLVLALFGGNVMLGYWIWWRNDESTDPAWQRGLRALGFILTFMAPLVALALLKD